jgi:hypothetical protein
VIVSPNEDVSWRRLTSSKRRPVITGGGQPRPHPAHSSQRPHAYVIALNTRVDENLHKGSRSTATTSPIHVGPV